ncbi:cell division protein FtsQ/DivIB [Paenibacillus tengchongensis]|uniref:cell division protein FtsQ/DivIB n=1 Tax=Paenibacillus tengchongensis TaxID=2608684 RepID=UPI00124C01A5|nr:FtsQ-type POTRA domain-containing protein [Paenibacillus tengchongensis]
MPKTRVPLLKEDKPSKKMSPKVIIILLLLFLALLAVIFFRSSLSRITEIQIQGNKYSTREELLKASGLRTGGQFFAVAGQSVEDALRELKTVQDAAVTKSFPGVVQITVTEYPAVAYELDEQGTTLEAILSSGATVEVNETGMPVEKPILTNWKADDPYKVKLSQALADIPDELTSDISEIVPSPTLSFPDRIKMYTRSQFEVITAISLLKEKVEYLNQVIETEEPGLIKMLEADSYVPFRTESQDEETIEE